MPVARPNFPRPKMPNGRAMGFFVSFIAVVRYGIVPPNGMLKLLLIPAPRTSVIRAGGNGRHRILSCMAQASPSLITIEVARRAIERN